MSTLSLYSAKIHMAMMSTVQNRMKNKTFHQTLAIQFNSNLISFGILNVLFGPGTFQGHPDTHIWCQHLWLQYKFSNPGIVYRHVSKWHYVFHLKLASLSKGKYSLIKTESIWTEGTSVVSFKHYY